MYFFIPLYFSTLTSVVASENHPSHRFALVLSGGGARGLSQIGVLKALEESQCKPDFIVGTSMGAVIGSFYAAGFSPDSIQHIVKSVDWNTVFSNSAKRNWLFVSQKSEPINYLLEIRLNRIWEPVPPNSISYGQAFFDLLGPYLAPAEFRAGMNFDSLPVPLRIVTTDLISGARVVFSRGNMAAAIRASCGVPLAFSPVYCDSMLLMDGGLSSNIPTSIARDEHAAVIVAVDVTSPLWGKSDLENPVRLMDQVVAIGMKRQKEDDKGRADIVVTPELSGFVNTDFSHIDTLIMRGYRSMKEHIDTLKKIRGGPARGAHGSLSIRPVEWRGLSRKARPFIDSMHAVRSPYSAKETGQRAYVAAILDDYGYQFGKASLISDSGAAMTILVDTGMVRDIRLSGNLRTSPDLIRTASGIHIGTAFSASHLRKAITNLYATNLFNNVNIDMDTLNAVRIMVDEKKYWRVRMGLRYDEFHLGEGYVQPAYENLFGRGVCALLHLQYGLRREKYALEFQSNHLFTSNFANNAKLQTYLSNERIFGDTLIIDSLNGGLDTTLWHKEKSLRKGGVLGMVGIQIGRSAMLSSGIHLEFYKVQSTHSSVFSNVWGLKFLPYALLRLSMDNLDRFPFPTSGMKHFFSIGGTNRLIGGNASFIKFDGSVSKIFTLFPKHTFSAQVRCAWSSSPLPEVEQIFMGGVFPEETHQDMEVYNYIPFFGMIARAMPGDIMGLTHIAYRFALEKNLFLTSGVDWGYAWDYEQFNFNNFGKDAVVNAPVGLGIGVAYVTIAGPLRFNYGRILRNLSPQGIPSVNRYYFSFGHDF